MGGDGGGGWGVVERGGMRWDGMGELGWGGLG